MATLRVYFLSLIAITTLCCGLSNKGFSVYGSWRWVKTQGAWTGDIYTPELSGFTSKVVFQENGIAQFYRNDTLFDQVQFTLSKTHLISRRKEANVIRWNHKNLPDNQYILLEGNDTLHLIERTTEMSHFYYVPLRN